MANIEKYPYQYLEGGVVAVDVEAKWAAVLELFDAEERSNERKHTRPEHRVYLAMNPHSGDNPDRQEVELVSHEPNPLDVVCMAEQKIALLQKLNTLTPRQKEVLALRLDDRKLSTRDIAERLGVSQTAVMKTLRLIEKKFPARGVSIDATE